MFLIQKSKRIRICFSFWLKSCRRVNDHQKSLCSPWLLWFLKCWLMNWWLFFGHPECLALWTSILMIHWHVFFCRLSSAWGNSQRFTQYIILCDLEVQKVAQTNSQHVRGWMVGCHSRFVGQVFIPAAVRSPLCSCGVSALSAKEKHSVYLKLRQCTPNNDVFWSAEVYACLC